MTTLAAGARSPTDRGSTYTAERFTALCRRLGIRQSIGRVGSCLGNAAAAAFFPSLEWEVLSRHQFTTTAQARATVIDWCYGCYNHLITDLRVPTERAHVPCGHWRALDRVTLCPQRIGAIAAAALVLTSLDRGSR